jgi:hypothetical protein
MAKKKTKGPILLDRLISLIELDEEGVRDYCEFKYSTKDFYSLSAEQCIDVILVAMTARMERAIRDM